MISRRSFLGQTVATGMSAATVPASGAMAEVKNRPRRDSSFVEILRMPDSVTAFSGLDTHLPLQMDGRSFAARDIMVHVDVQSAELNLRLTAPATELTHIHVRWLAAIHPKIICLGDHWERSYGDLAWRGMVPDRAMPWYFATHDGSAAHAYGVKTGAGAMCFWQIDPEGISLWLDVRNGGDGVLLGSRELHAATVVTRRGAANESPMVALRSFCGRMSPAPRLLKTAVYGVNDWYYAYGKNNQNMLLRMADLVAELAPPAGPRPYAVVDEGWKDGSATFPSMASYAAQVKQRGVHPGIWIRPLRAMPGADPKLLLPNKRFGERASRYQELAFDPTIAEALALVTRQAKDTADWGFELVKHDYSTYDLLGQWGFEMGATPTLPGWHFNDRTRTNAEIILDLYNALRTAVGDRTAILGCNTVGHLGAGVFEMQRTGDDVGGMWDRTRRMGVNTLAYRLPQHGTFFHLDADCVAITKAAPWEMTRQWLDVVARSRTTLFISPEEGEVGAEQRAALRQAFAEVTAPGPGAEPADFVHDTTPEDWKQSSGLKHYSWSGAAGASPFPV